MNVNQSSGMQNIAGTGGSGVLPRKTSDEFTRRRFSLAGSSWKPVLGILYLSDESVERLMEV